MTLVDSNGENATPYSSPTIDKEQLKEAFVGATGGLRRQEDNSLLISEAGVFHLEHNKTYIVVVPRGNIIHIHQLTNIGAAAPASPVTVPFKVRDPSEQIRSVLTKPPSSIPSLSSLSSYLLSFPDTKIPLNTTQYSHLESTLGSSSLLLTGLFIPSETEHCSLLWDTCLTKVIHPIPPQLHTEASFHGFWDCIIKFPLSYFNSSLIIGRDADQHTLTQCQLPDFVVLLDKLCLFRGEEKGDDSFVDPVLELKNKLNWNYNGN